MKKFFVKDLVRDTDVNDYFIVVKKGTYLSRNNTKYMTLRLKDRTGSIEGRVWERVDELATGFERNDLVYVESKAKMYQESLQLSVTNIRKVEQELSADELKEFYPESDSGNSDLRKAFFDLISGLKNPYLKALFVELEKRKDSLERFFYLPASIGVHHVYIGGLLEHSVNLATMAKGIASLTKTDEDLLVSGSLLHDIGKVEELTIKGGFGYSDKGRLLGHITLGIMLCDGLIAGIDGFPAYLGDVIKHIILSHHGEAEWGSPKKPMCLEALVIHYLDNLDAKVVGVREHMQENMDDETWTQYHKLFESRFYKLPER
ncbi:MAG TPA: HD domain-containing protein [Syntrophorhabdales bacterium]|nr:HD domain-containing protein [Syntrophorhabdales bacterium]